MDLLSFIGFFHHFSDSVLDHGDLDLLTFILTLILHSCLELLQAAHRLGTVILEVIRVVLVVFWQLIAQLNPLEQSNRQELN